MATIQQQLDNFNPATAGAYDPGQVVVFFDNRAFKSSKDQLSYFQNYWLDTKYRLGWPSLWYTNDLEPGKLRLTWYTHAGAEGKRDFPLHLAYNVKEMFDSLADEGFRPMIIGWSLENPYPMIGGSEPPAPPQKPKEPKRATTWSMAAAGHNGEGNPHERVMKIIKGEEEREGRERAEEVVSVGVGKDGGRVEEKSVV